MRYIFVLLSIFVFGDDLYSKPVDESCYTIQTGSFSKTSAKEIRSRRDLPKECRIVQKQNSVYAVMCECGSENEIRKKLPRYKAFVADAFLTKTKSRYFYKKEKKSTVKRKEKKHRLTLSDKKESLKLNELIYKVFIYNNDLANAKKVVRKSLKSDPGNLVWRRRLADVLSWSGNQKEAFRHYSYIYEKDKDKTVADLKSETFGGYEAYFTLLGNIYKSPGDDKSIKRFLKTALKLGIADNALDALDKVYEKTANATILKECAQFSYDTGKKERALRYLKRLKKSGSIDVKRAIILSRILFEKKEFDDSLKTLLGVKHLAKNSDGDYWYLLSDLYSFLGKSDKSGEILGKFCLLNSCRRVDYDNLISHYLCCDEDFVSKISLKAWREFRESSYFFAYAKANLKRKRVRAVIKMISSLTEKEKKAFEKEPLYWLVTASVNEETRDFKEALKAYERALLLDPSSSEILGRYGWFLLNHEYPHKLETILPAIEDKAFEDDRLYILAAAANYKLNRIKKSYLYYKKALDAQPQNYDLKLDFSNLLQVMGRDEESLKIRKEIFSKLQGKLKKDHSLLKKRDFLITYLRSSLYFISAENYRSLLEYASKVLDKSSYQDLEISWAVYRSDDEYVRYLSKKLENPQLWLKIYLALKENDTYKMRELLYRYGALLPTVGKIEAQLATKEISKAASGVFEALRESPENYQLYKIKYEMDKHYSDKTDSEFAYENQKTLKRSYVKIDNLFHVGSSYYLGSLFRFSKNTPDLFLTNDDRPKDLNIGLWIRKLLKMGYLDIGGGYKKDFTSNVNFFFDLYTKVTQNLGVEVKIHKNDSANESVELYLNGEKDFASFGFNYQFNDRIGFETKLVKSGYRFKNGEVIGNSDIYHLEARQRVKFQYPDILLREFVNVASYFAKHRNRILPRDFTQAGIGLQIGKNALQNYSASWRPYADLTLSYHDRFGLYLNGEAGASGRFLGSDRLCISLNYGRMATDDDPLWIMKISHSYLY